MTEAVEAPSPTPLRELTALSSWFKGTLLLRGRKEGEREGKKGLGAGVHATGYFGAFTVMLRPATVVKVWQDARERLKACYNSRERPTTMNVGENLNL